MSDTDRKSVYCQHGNLLYECNDPYHDTPAVSVGRIESQEKIIYRYHGTATIETRITDRTSDMFGGSQIDYVTCAHDHETPEKARRCASRIAATETRKRNRHTEMRRRSNERERT